MKIRKFQNNIAKRPFSKTSPRGTRFKLKPVKKSLRFSSLLKRRRQSYFIISRAYGRLPMNEIEAVRKTIRRLIAKKRNLIFVRVCPTIPLTSKPIQSRMGRGKGSRNGKYIYFAKPGKILFEIETSAQVSKLNLFKLFKKATAKLSIYTGLLSLKDLYFN